jgi:transcriptional regulator with XRE-family HTH domain
MKQENRLGELLAQGRRAKGYSVRRAAALAGMEHTQLDNIEHNKRPGKKGTPERPSPSKLDKLAEVLDLNPEELRIAAAYPIPLDDGDIIATEIAANVKDLPDHVQKIVLTQVRAVRRMFAVGSQEEGREGNGEVKPDDKERRDAGVKPGDPEYKEPSGTITPPPLKERGQKPKKGEKQSRKSA